MHNMLAFGIGWTLAFAMSTQNPYLAPMYMLSCAAAVYTWIRCNDSGEVAQLREDNENLRQELSLYAKYR